MASRHHAYRRISSQFLVGIILLFTQVTPFYAEISLPDRTGTLWAPFIEWSLANPSYEGNPFDLVATVRFIHEQSGEKHTTEMFYTGDHTWRFRFTGTRIGRWSFNTSSADQDLDSHHGKLTILPDPNPDLKGFLTHQGNKYAVQRGNDSDLEGYVFNVYMGRVNFDSYLETFGTDSAQIVEKTIGYLSEALDNGFEIIFLHVNNNWLKYGVRTYSEHDSENPDTVCFRALETIITSAHAAGGRVHLWAWGDEQRKWTPTGLPGGTNGHLDRRLQRYIAARLGPLPGWTMGYGFDLHEWTNSDQVNAWAHFLHNHFGWQHLLSARGFILSGQNNINSYDNFGRDVPLNTTRGGPQDYREVAANLSTVLTTPHLYEERHTFRRPQFKLDMEGTRRLLWWQTMAGGMGGFFGFYPPDGGSFGGYPYTAPEQLRTHYIFWHTHRRFLLEMQRANLSADSGVYVLKNDNNTCYVIFKENGSTVQFDLSDMKGPEPAVAVDTKQSYTETKLGVLKPVDQKIVLPYLSDWAITIGDFSYK